MKTLTLRKVSTLIFCVICVCSLAIVSQSFAGSNYLPIVPTDKGSQPSASEPSTEEVLTDSDEPRQETTTANFQDFRQTEPVTFSITQVPLSNVVQLLGREFDRNIVLADNLYADDEPFTVSLNYTGHSIEQVLSLFCQAYDLYWENLEDIGYIISKTQTAAFKIRLPSERSYSASFGQAASKVQQSGGKQLSIGKSLRSQLEPFLTIDGAMSISEAGILTVKDRPSAIRLIRQTLQLEEAQKELLQYNVKLVRAEVSANTSSKIDWSSGQVVHEWQNSGFFGETLPYISSASQIFKDTGGNLKETSDILHSNVTIFLTPTQHNKTDIIADVYVEVQEETRQPSSWREAFAVDTANALTSKVLLEKNQPTVITGLTFNRIFMLETSKETRVEYALMITVSEPGQSTEMRLSRPMTNNEQIQSTQDLRDEPCDEILYEDPHGVF